MLPSVLTRSLSFLRSKFLISLVVPKSSPAFLLPSKSSGYVSVVLINSSTMPVLVIGKPTTLRGKYLFEILRNLKDFGVGRTLVRSSFERYPEPSYYVVKAVRPIMDPEGKYGEMDAETVFRGRNIGVQPVYSAFKADWRLIPKDEEEQYKVAVRPGLEDVPLKRVVPAAVPFPPLLRRMVLDEAKRAGRALEEPMLPLSILRGPFNIPTQEGVEAPLGASKLPGNPVNTILPQSMAPHLFLSNRNVKKPK